MPRTKKKFNLKRGISKIKSEGKKMPKRVAKQLPNAALTLAGGGLVGGAVKGARALSAARKASKLKKGVRVPRRVKVAGQKAIRVKNPGRARMGVRKTRPVKFRITRR